MIKRKIFIKKSEANYKFQIAQIDKNSLVKKGKLILNSDSMFFS